MCDYAAKVQAYNHLSGGCAAGMVERERHDVGSIDDRGMIVWKSMSSLEKKGTDVQ